MEETQDVSRGEEAPQDEVMDSLGMPHAEEDESPAEERKEGSKSHATLNVQKRLKAQKRQHEREVRELHARIGDLERRTSQPNASRESSGIAYDAPQSGDIEGHIHKAVGLALQAQEEQARKAREQEQMAHVQRSYQDFEKHLDGMADKYDDFHDVVYAHDVPYTSAMRDYAMTLPRSGAGSAGEVLYKLGKPENRAELERISKLHPLDQAREVAKLSHALISGGGESKNALAKQPLGNIKNNPVVNSAAITDKTSVSELRRRMKAGFK